MQEVTPCRRLAYQRTGLRLCRCLSCLDGLAAEPMTFPVKAYATGP